MELIEVRGIDFCCFNEFSLPLKGMGLTWVTGKNHDTKSAENNGCLSGSTLIDCPRDLKKYPKGIPIRELVGKTPWVYCWKGGKISISQASKVWKTKTDETVVVELSKYETKRGPGFGGKWNPPQVLVGTADHRVLLADGETWKAMGDLEPGDRLCSLYRRESGGWRTLIHWTGQKDAISEQQFVCSEINGERPEDSHAHHKDGNKWNHSVENLEWKDLHEHHSEHTSERNKKGLSGWQASGVHPRGMLGKKHTVESLEKIAETSRGRVKSAEERAKLSAALKGRVISEETRARMSKSAKDRCKRQREERGEQGPNHTVLSVKKHKRMDVYDMEVPCASNFIANGVVVHNSGKSTLFKALTWGLYGQSVDGERGDKVIRQGQARARVEVVLEHDGEQWIVIRERKKGQPSVSMYCGPNEVKANKKEIQERIDAMVGLDFMAFRNTVLYGQNDTSRFAHPGTSDVDRKKTLHRILRTGLLALCHEKVRSMRTSAKKGLSAIETSIAELRARLDELDPKGIQRRFDGFESDRKTRVESAKELSRDQQAIARHNIKAAKKTAPKKGKEIKAVKQRIKRLEAEHKVKLAESKGQDQLRKELEAVGRIMDEHQKTLSKDEAELHQVEKQLKRLDSKKCPTCTAPLNKGVAGKYVSGLAERRSDLIGHIQPLYESLADQRNVAAQLSKRLNEKRLASDAAGEVLEDINEAQRELAGLRKAGEKHRQEQDSYKQKARLAIQRARDYAGQAEQIENEANPYKEQLDIAKKKAKEYKDKLKRYKTERGKERAHLAHIEFWVKGFSSQGLPSYLLDAAMPYITNRANDHLRILSDGDIQVNFTTQREMKSSKGEFRDAIDIQWTVEGVEGYPPSGGQMKKIEIATDLALMDLVASREGGIGVLCLDEILDGLDAEGRQRVVLLLKEIRKRRGSIFVISHDTSMADAFERSVIVEKRDGVSRVRIAA